MHFKEQLRDADLSLRASSISFFFILALFPSIIFFFSLIPYIPIKHLNGSVMKALKDILPLGAFHLLEATIRDIISVQRGGLLSINFFIALFIASNGVNSIMKAFDKMNHSFRDKNFWSKRLTAIRILFLVTLQVIIALLLIVKGKEFLSLSLHMLHSESQATIYLLRALKSILILFSFFNIITLIYYYGLDDKRKYRYFSAGATFATLFSIMMSIIFKFYAAYLNNFNRLYGSLGIIIVIMMMIYLNALVLLFGFELNNSIATHKLLRIHSENPED